MVSAEPAVDPKKSKRRWALRVGIVVLVVVGVVVTFNFYTGSSSPQSPSSGLKGFLAADQTDAAFVQWTRTGDTVTGSLQSASLPSDASQALKQDSNAFTGVIHDHDVALTFSALGFSETSNGRLDGDTLTLTASNATAGLATTKFHKASLEEYQQAVSSLQTTRQQNLTTQQQAVQQSAQLKQAQKNDADITKELQNLRSATSDMNDAWSQIDGQVAKVKQALGTTQTALDKTKKDNGVSPMTQTQAYVVQSDMYDVQSREYDTQGAMYDVTATQSKVTDASQRIDDAAGKLRASQQALNDAMKGSSFTPTNDPPTVGNTIADAQKQRDAITAALSGKVATAQGYVDLSEKLYSDAQDVSNDALGRYVS